MIGPVMSRGKEREKVVTGVVQTSGIGEAKHGFK